MWIYILGTFSYEALSHSNQGNFNNLLRRSVRLYSILFYWKIAMMGACVCTSHSTFYMHDWPQVMNVWILSVFDVNEYLTFELEYNI